jgi:hypothetical protein
MSSNSGIKLAFLSEGSPSSHKKRTKQQRNEANEAVNLVQQPTTPTTDGDTWFASFIELGQRDIVGWR